MGFYKGIDGSNQGSHIRFMSCWLTSNIDRNSCRPGGIAPTLSAMFGACAVDREPFLSNAFSGSTREQGTIVLAIMEAPAVGFCYALLCVIMSSWGHGMRVTIPSLEPNLCKQDLLWTIWSPRDYAAGSHAQYGRHTCESRMMRTAMQAA